MTQLTKANWDDLNEEQQTAIHALLDLINGGQDMEEALYSYRTVSDYIVSHPISTYES